ncbi:MAG: hypothetical protein KatS3mg114_1293 [Planctomycetaceae bacterium]|nr:MAG: hypothetical protein KatS3mg114_1293 [Planctomycetaceae bacterium]
MNPSLSDHVHETLLRAWVLGTLPDEVVLKAQRHVQTCPTCAALVRRWFEEPTVEDGALCVDPAPGELTREQSRSQPSAAHPLLQPQRVFGGDSPAFGQKTCEQQSHPAAHSPGELPMIAEYELLAELGHGGMGVVYKALHRPLNRIVALKMLLAGRWATPRMLNRFLFEARTAAAIKHPYIVPIYAFGYWQGLPYYTMPYIKGRALHALLAEGPLEVKTAARLVCELAQAMACAHQMGIVHRDLKPHNVIIDTEGHPHILDFGLAKWTAEENPLTHSGEIVGTPNYMAPEQVRGETRLIGPPTDVYALGAILYALLTGRPPLQAAHVVETLRLVENQDPAPPRVLNPTIPWDLEKVCLKALQKSPERRYATAAEIGDDLQRFLEGRPVLARAIGYHERVFKWCRRHVAETALLGTLLLVTIVGLSWLLYYDYSLALSQLRAQHYEHKSMQLAEQRQRAEDAANMQLQYSLLHAAQREVAHGALGWPSRTQALIEQAAEAAPLTREVSSWRSVLAASLQGTEFRTAAQFLPGYDSGTVAFHPQHPWLAVGKRRAEVYENPFRLSIHLLEYPSGKKLRTWMIPTQASEYFSRGKPDLIRQLRWCPQGRWLVAITRFANAWLIDSTNPQPSEQLLPLGYHHRVCLQFAPDGQTLYTAAYDPQDQGVVKRWQLGSSATLLVSQPVQKPMALAFGQDSSQLLVLSSEMLLVLKADTLELQQRLPHHSADHFSAAPTGDILLFSSPFGLLWGDTQGGLIRGPLQPHLRAPFHSGMVSSLLWSPTGEMFLHQAYGGNSIHIWDAASGQVLAEWPHQDMTGDAAFDATGHYVAISDNRQVQLLEIVRSPEHTVAAVQLDPVLASTLSPTGTELITIAHDHSNSGQSACIRAWDVTHTSCRPIIRLQYAGLGKYHLEQAAGAYHPQGDYYVVTAVFDATVACYRSGNHECLWGQKFTSPRDVTFTTDGAQLWLADDTDIYATTDIERPVWRRWSNPWAKLNGTGLIYAMAAGRHRVLAGDREGKILLFSTELPPVTNSLSPLWVKVLLPRDTVTALALAADEQHAYAAGLSGDLVRIRLSDAATQRVVAAHREGINQLLMLSDDVLISGSQDHTVRFWRWPPQAEKPELLFEMIQKAPVTRLTLSAQKNKLGIVAAQEHGVHLWDLDALFRRFESLGLMW